MLRHSFLFQARECFCECQQTHQPNKQYSCRFQDGWWNCLNYLSEYNDKSIVNKEKKFLYIFFAKQLSDYISHE